MEDLNTDSQRRLSEHPDRGKERQRTTFSSPERQYSAPTAGEKKQ